MTKKFLILRLRHIVAQLALIDKIMISSPGYFAKQAYAFQTDKVKRSVSYLIRECSSKLSLKNKNIDLALLKLSKIQKYSPELHYFHHDLQSAMRNQDPISARKSLHKLINVIINHSSINEWVSISSIGSSEWENFAINEAIRSMKEECTEEVKIFPVQEPILSLIKDTLNAAIYTIARYDAETFDEICELVKVIKLFSGDGLVGITDVRLYGAMLIRIPDQNIDPIPYFIEQLVHEASHIYLNGLLATDSIVLNSPEDRFVSPLRTKLRPMISVFHATYVSARVFQSFLALYLMSTNIKFLHHLTRTLNETIRGVREIKKNAILTSYGRQLINNISILIELFESFPKQEYHNFTKLKSHFFCTQRGSFLFQRIAA